MFSSRAAKQQRFSLPYHGLESSWTLFFVWTEEACNKSGYVFVGCHQSQVRKANMEVERQVCGWKKNRLPNWKTTSELASGREPLRSWGCL